MLVSIVLTTYKRDTVFKRALESVLKQTYKNIEIIVIDDNGLKNEEYSLKIEEIIKNSKDSRIKLLKNEKNKGANYSRNKGIKISTGEYVFLLDDDDHFVDKKIELMLDKAIESKADILYSGAYLINKDQKKFLFNYSFNPKRDILFKNFIGSNSFVMLKKKIFLTVGYYDEKLESCQDWDLWIRILQNDLKISSLKIPLVYYEEATFGDKITKNYLKVHNGHKKIFNKTKKYLDEFDFSDQDLIKLEQNNRLARIEYQNGKFKEYRKIVKINSFKELFKFLFSMISLKIENKKISKV